MTALRLGSLCTGFGALDQAVADVLGDVELAFVADPGSKLDDNRWDLGPPTLLAHHYPDVPNLGDISTVDWDQVEDVDILTAGFPCQDVSLAGKQAGIQGDRIIAPEGDAPCGCTWMNHDVWCEQLSPLGWAPFEAGSDDRALAAVAALNQKDGDDHPEWLVRGNRSGVWTSVAAAIKGTHPKLVLIENVGGLLSARAHSDLEPCPWCMGDQPGDTSRIVLRALGAVLGDLADLGFDAEWATVAASDVGAAHRRRRVFILAWPADSASDARRLVHRNLRAVPDLYSVGQRPDLSLVRAGESDTDRCGSGRDGLNLLPTATAALVGNRVDTNMSGDGRTTPNKLGWAVGSPLPIPTASDGTGAGHAAQGGRNLRTEVTLLPTPMARDGKGVGPADAGRKSPGLSAVGALLPTPRATDGAAESDGSGGRNNRGEPKLSGIKYLLPTPAVGDSRATRNATAGRKDGSEHHDGWTLSDIAYADRWGQYAQAIARWETVVGWPAPDPTTPSRSGNPQLNAVFVEWLQGCDEGHVTGVPGLTRNQMLRLLGNGVVKQQGAYAFRHLLTASGLIDSRSAA